MGKLGEILRHPDEIYPLMKVKLAAKKAHKQIVTSNPKPHWAFCYSTLPKVSQSLPFLIRQLPLQLRHIVCVLYLVLRALDTVEDDTSIPKDVKVPILIDFHKHIFDPQWHFSCGTKECAVLMDNFHHVSTALLEFGKSYQEAIEDATKRIGAGMAKFICKEVETVDDYDEYCHYAAGLVGCCLSRIFHISGFEDLAPGYLSNSMGLFLQKQSVIRDYWEDINEIPKPRMFWPRQIWSKYANKLEDLQYEENSVKAVQCLNEMATNALVHVNDCFKYMSAIRDPAIFRLVAIPQVMGIVMLELCYNNIKVFRGLVKIRHGLSAKIFCQTRTMADVYRAFFDFADMMKSKVDMSDPNAEKTLSRLEAVQKTCMNSGMLHTRKSYIDGSWPSCNFILVVLVIIAMAIMLAILGNRPTN